MRRTLHASPRAGGALLLAVTLVALTAVAAGAILGLSTATSGRQSAAVDNKRAFYIAEAGLSEAYAGLSAGLTGHIGTAEAPAKVGDGLVWVQASLIDPDHMRLRSSAVCGKGQAALEVIVQRVVQPVGIFSDEPLELDVPFLLDGYDSSAGSYADQATEGSGAAGPATYVDPGTGVPLLIDLHAEYIGEPSVIQVWELPSSHAGYKPFSAVTILGVYPPGFVEDYLAATGYVEPPRPPRGTPPPSGVAHGSLGVHTTGGGILGSNGDIELSAGVPAEIYGDVEPGAGRSFDGTAEVSGLAEARGEPLAMRSVFVPDVELQGALNVFAGAPLVVPAGVQGYAALRAGAGALITVQGPATLVLGELELEAGATLVLDNADGAIELTVLGPLTLDPASLVETESETPGDLVLQVAGGDPVALEAVSQFHGLVYAPQAEVSIGLNFEVYGVIVAHSLDLAPYARLHFDSGYAGAALPTLMGWRLVEMPRELDPALLAQLTLDPSSFQSAADAHKLGQYFVNAVYSAADTLRKTYSGPLDGWDPSDVAVMVSIEIVPHDYTFEEDWLIYIEYRDAGASLQTYTGSVPGLPIADVVSIEKLKLTAPPDFDEVVYGSPP
jgi:hypothetical protein